MAGVAAGFGRYLDVDPVLARLGFVLLAFVNGLGVLIYLAGWALMPREDAASAGAGRRGPAPAAAGFESLRDACNQLAAEVHKATGEPRPLSSRSARSWSSREPCSSPTTWAWLHWPYWMRFQTLWPLLLVALGLGLVAKSRKPASA